MNKEQEAIHQWERNHDRWSAGLDPLPVDLDALDAGAVVDAVLALYAEDVSCFSESINLDPCGHLLAQASSAVATMLGHPEIAKSLHVHAYAVFSAD